MKTQCNIAKMPRSCIVPKCKTGYKSCKEKLSVFKVPTDENARKTWEVAIPGVATLNPHHCVCEKHFEEKFIRRKYVHEDSDGNIIAEVPYKQTRLAESAVPSIFHTEETKPTVDQNSREDQIVKSEMNQESTNPQFTGPSDAVIFAAKVPETAKKNITQNVASITSVRALEITNDEKKNVDTQSCSRVPSAGSMSAADSADVINSEMNGKEHQSNSNQSIPSAARTENSTVNRGVKVATGCMTKDLLVISSTCVGTEDAVESCVTLPKPWIASEGTSAKGRYLCLSYISVKPEDEIQIPVLAKSIMIDTAKILYYYVHGKLIEVKSETLPRVLLDLQMLPTVLLNFQYMDVCRGLASKELYIMAGTKAFKDPSGYWRHNECSLLSVYKHCKLCNRLRKTLLQKKSRLNVQNSRRISRVLNPADQKKLEILRKKVHVIRNLKNRAKHRGQLLKKSLEEVRNEMAQMEEHSIEEKCLAMNITDTQKTAIKEIVAAASMNDVRGHRYSEEWIMLCILMNIRSPTFYDLLRNNNVLPLPCRKTVRNYLSLIDSKCGFDENFSKLLSKHFLSKD